MKNLIHTNLSGWVCIFKNFKDVNRLLLSISNNRWQWTYHKQRQPKNICIFLRNGREYISRKGLRLFTVCHILLPGRWNRPKIFSKQFLCLWNISKLEGTEIPSTRRAVDNNNFVFSGSELIPKMKFVWCICALFKNSVEISRQREGEVSRGISVLYCKNSFSPQWRYCFPFLRAFLRQRHGFGRFSTERTFYCQWSGWRLQKDWYWIPAGW